jgi:hypothetical protein
LRRLDERLALVRRRRVEPEPELRPLLPLELLLLSLPLELVVFAASRTRPTRSSGSSEARVFASSTTPFALREKDSLRTSA